tara:strand:+ start:3765 stop:4010 length:246 start_codon:yes stop_codon:yes gene_type:complete
VKSERTRKIEEITAAVNAEGEKVTFDQVEHWVGSDASLETIDEYLYGLSVEDGDDRDEAPLGPENVDDILSLWRDTHDEVE